MLLHTMQRESTSEHVTASARNRTFVIAHVALRISRYEREISRGDSRSTGSLKTYEWNGSEWILDFDGIRWEKKRQNKYTIWNKDLRDFERFCKKVELLLFDIWVQSCRKRIFL